MEIDVKILKQGNPQCKHVWERVSITNDCIPPIHHRTCEKCGHTESYSYSEEIVYLKDYGLN